jgi:lipopolysaccharide export LptBFGC system permease protein LptF
MRKLCLALFIAIIFTILSTGCISKNGSNTDKSVYDKTKTPLQNKLMQYDYEIAKESNEEVIYIIQGEDNSLDFKKFTVSENDELNLILKENEKFIVSLYSNETVKAEWILEYNDTYVKVESEELLNNFKEVPINSTGMSYRRKFFTLTALDIDKTTLNFKYKSLDFSSDFNPFTFKINIEIK